MKLLLLLFPVLALAGSHSYFPWEGYSDPAIMSRDLEKNFRKLPLSGSIRSENKFWSGDYWPLRKGNINYRWKAPKPTGFNLRSPTREEARRMSLAQLSHLSPSEKYDLYLGRYDYPLKTEVEKIANRNARNWEGICHGLAPASMNHQEPYAKGAMNPDGIRIPFGSADIKALLSYYYANGFISPTHQMGRRCYENGNDVDCEEDLNAGAFHIVMVNKIAFRNEGIIIDLKRGQEVWNHPIISFESQTERYDRPLPSSAPGTVRRAKIKTTAVVVNGTGNYWERVKGTALQKEGKEKYVYFLDLDVNDVIVGGDWESENRPDFLWVKYRPSQFNGLLSRLPELLND